MQAGLRKFLGARRRDHPGTFLNSPVPGATQDANQTGTTHVGSQSGRLSDVGSIPTASTLKSPVILWDGGAFFFGAFSAPADGQLGSSEWVRLSLLEGSVQRHAYEMLPQISSLLSPQRSLRFLCPATPKRSWGLSAFR